MELRNVNTFIKTAELLNFTKAAQELGYSQSAVTFQIRQLEEETGALLFERIGKTVTLTPEGEAFLEYAYELRRLAERTVNFARKKDSVVEGVIRIGTAESICTRVFPGIIQELHAKYPLIRLVLSVDVTENNLHRLRRNQIDLAYFDNYQLWDADLVKAMEKKDEFSIICSSKHPLAGKFCTLEELVREPFILTEKGLSYRDPFDKMLTERGLSVTPFLEVGNIDLIIELLRNNLGISLLPTFTVNRELESGALAEIFIPEYETEIYRQLIYHKNKWLTPALEKIIEIIRAEAESL